MSDSAAYRVDVRPLRPLRLMDAYLITGSRVAMVCACGRPAETVLVLDFDGLTMALRTPLCPKHLAQVIRP